MSPALSLASRRGCNRTGVSGRVRPHHLVEAVSQLMGNAGRRSDIAARARQLVDGLGAKRVANRLLALLRS